MSFVISRRAHRRIEKIQASASRAGVRLMNITRHVTTGPLELSDDERLRIAEALLHSVGPDNVASVDDAGAATELRRRVAEIEAGERTGVSWAELRSAIESA